MSIDTRAYARQRKVGFQLSDLVEAEYTATELKDAHYNVDELKEMGFSATAMRVAGFNSRQLRAARYKLTELQEGGFAWQDLGKRRRACPPPHPPQALRQLHTFTKMLASANPT